MLFFKGKFSLNATPFILLIVLSFCFSFQVVAQNNPYYIIDKVIIEGNKKTQDRIILRELNITIGDTVWLNNETEFLETNRNQVYNLALFNTVELALINENLNSASLEIKVQERWYWLVFPIFELADRNFNVWWRDFNHDFRRTKYGFIAVKNNVGGRNETFVLNFKWGFNRKIIFQYKFPFIDKKKIWGLNLQSYYFADRELAYQSVDNEAIFYKHSSFANNRFGAGVQLNRRADIKNTHSISANYFLNTIVDTLQEISPSYFNNFSQKQQFFSLQYEFEHDGRNIRAYPTKGWYFRGRLAKTGLGIFGDINRYAVEANVSKYTQLSEHTLVGANIKAHSSFGDKTPYNNSLRLGFLEHFVRGYEYYVIDVQHYLMFKTALKQKVFDINYKGLQKIGNQFKTIPIQVYAKAFNEVGFIKDKYFQQNNPLNNELLSGYGFGIDVVTFYDNFFSFEYTFNRRKEHGFFLHINTTWDYK